MDLSVLSTVLALAVFVGCFRPLVRRAGAHTNVWFLGWIFLLVHYIALLLATGHENTLDMVRVLIALLTLHLSAFCFLVAASNARLTPTNQILFAEFGIPVLIEMLLYFFESTSRALALGASLLLALPAIHLAIRRQDRSRPFNQLAIGFAAIAVMLAPFVRLDPYVRLNIILCALFLAAACLTFAQAKRMTRGVTLMVAGLGLWGLSFLLQANSWFDANQTISHALLDLPRLITAAGMILALLDDYVGRTESLALHDPLTGLPNRRMFEIRLDQAIEDSIRTRTPIACFVIDVDNFKYINDNFGHPVGDGLLQALAKRLSWNLGPNDMLARTGGDEFTAVLVEAADEFHIRFIAGAMMAAGCVPVSINNHAIDVRISIGIAVSPQDAGDSSELHKAADDAMYRAKRRGGSVIAFSNEEVPQIHAV